MTAHAERRRRRRRIAFAAVLALALAIAAVMGGLWRRSVTEARRAEASKLLAVAQLQLETDPTEALAYVTASLELNDTEDTRLFAQRVLWEAPLALEIDVGDAGGNRGWFSPDGSRLASAGPGDVRVWTEDGGPPLVLPGYSQIGPEGVDAGWLSNDLLMTGSSLDGRARIWSIPGGELIREIDLGGEAWGIGVEKDHLFAEVYGAATEDSWKPLHLRAWSLPNGELTELGVVTSRPDGFNGSFFTSGGTGWWYLRNHEIYVRPLPIKAGVPDRLVSRHENPTFPRWPWLLADRLWTQDSVTGELRLWDLSEPSDEPLRVNSRPTGLEDGIAFSPLDPAGRWIHSTTREVRIADSEDWPEARPLRLRRSGSWWAVKSTFHPQGKWLVVGTHATNRLTFWPLPPAWPVVVDGYHTRNFRPLVFSPDGQWLASRWTDGFRLWPLPGSGPPKVKELPLPELLGTTPFLTDLVFDPQGRFLVAAQYTDSAHLLPLDGSMPRRLDTASESGRNYLSNVAVSPSGRGVATAIRVADEGEGDRKLWVWGLETDDRQAYEVPTGPGPSGNDALGVLDLAFADDSTLFTAGAGGVRRWNLDTGTFEMVLPTKPGSFAMSAAFGPSAGTAFVMEPMPGDLTLGPTRVLDLATGETRVTFSFSDTVRRSQNLRPRIAFDATDTIAATGDAQGVIRVARLTGGEPHLLLGHEGAVMDLAISPDERWLASSGEDDTLRLWPMPDLDKPPLHTLPHDELIAKLESLTNLRAVRDPESSTGWSIEIGPFPGWKEVPTW